MRVWTYAIATDVGGAPNFEGPAATLAICKPPIRRGAGIGDLVLAFNGRGRNGMLARVGSRTRCAGPVL